MSGEDLSPIDSGVSQEIGNPVGDNVAQKRIRWTSTPESSNRGEIALLAICLPAFRFPVEPPVDEMNPLSNKSVSS